MVKGSRIGDEGSGRLEHPRQLAGWPAGGPASPPGSDQCRAAQSRAPPEEAQAPVRSASLSAKNSYDGLNPHGIHAAPKFQYS